MLIDRLKNLTSSRYVLNIGWLGGAELVQRVFRLGATVVLARLFSKTDYGMVSAIYSVFEFANVISVRGGISAKVVQADEDELEQVCQTAYSLNWVIMVSLFVIQCLLAYPIALYYKNTALVFPICALGLSYLVIPSYMVQAALLDRRNLLQVRAWCMAAQAIVTNLIVMAMAFLGYGVWAVVWGIVISYLVWYPIIAHFSQWKPKQFPHFSAWRSILSFGGKRLGVDLLNRFRQDADYLIVARFLGLSDLGVYFFAYSAGIGISQGVINSFASAWYPYFCEVRRERNQLRGRFLRSLKTIGMTIAPLVVVQSCLAPFYVPIVFGDKWIDAIPILIIICLSAVPMALAQATSKLLQAMDEIGLDIAWNTAFTTIFIGALVIAVPYGILPLAITVLVVRWLCIPLFTLFILRRKLPHSPAIEGA